MSDKQNIEIKNPQNDADQHILDPVRHLATHRPDFNFDKVPLLWRDNSPLKTFFENTLSIMLPMLEDAMIKAMNEAKEHIKPENSELIKQIEVFCEQEETHALVHSQFNKRLEQQGIDVKYYQEYISEYVDFLNSKPLLDRLEISALFETMTSVVSRVFFKHVTKGTIDSEVKRLWSWHCIEELEHRCVAHTVYKHLAQSYRPSFFKTMSLSLQFMKISLSVTFKCLKKHKMLFQLRLIKDIYWLITVQIFNLAIGWLRFLHKDYDPFTAFNDDFTNELLSQWESSYHNKSLAR